MKTREYDALESSLMVCGVQGPSPDTLKQVVSKSFHDKGDPSAANSIGSCSSLGGGRELAGWRNLSP
eukprot:6785784-Pyramimonas_sp.AAC.1